MKNLREKDKKDGLVAILKNPHDLTILQDQGWYRIPIASAPKGWPPEWLAFYQPKNFKADAYQIKYYGHIKEIRQAKREELFPNEIRSSISEKEYYVLHLDSLEELEIPIPSFRPRRIVFIPTTWWKFEHAEEINDLFDGSPLEDKLWKELKRISISAERQWAVLQGQRFYFLDFALFCNNGQINVETDGDYWHGNPERIPLDNARDNALQINGWTVLRYNTLQIMKRFQSECLRGIEASINKLGGLTSDGLIPRSFYAQGDQSVQQLSIFDKGENDYMMEAGIDLIELD